MTATASRITIEAMQAKYNPQVSRLIVHGFRGKFQHLTNLSGLLFFSRSCLINFPLKRQVEGLSLCKRGKFSELCLANGMRIQEKSKKIESFLRGGVFTALERGTFLKC